MEVGRDAWPPSEWLRGQGITRRTVSRRSVSLAQRELLGTVRAEKVNICLGCAARFHLDRRSLSTRVAAMTCALRRSLYLVGCL